MVTISNYVIEYSSTLYVRMARNKRMASACARTHTNVSVEVSNIHGNARFMIKNGKNIDAKLSRAASQHGSKSNFFFHIQHINISYAPHFLILNIQFK